MELSTKENSSDSSHLTSTIADKLRSVNTQFGTFEFEEVIGQVHGSKVYTSSDTFSRRHHDTVSIETEVETIHEFWVRPMKGGRDRLIKLKNHDFRAADSQVVLLMFAKAKTTFDEPLFLANLDSKEAIELSTTGASNHVQEELVGPPRNSVLLWFGTAMIAVPVFAWYKTNSAVISLASFITAVVVGAVIGSKMPIFNNATTNLNSREFIEKKFEASYVIIREGLTESEQLRWATASKPKPMRLN